MDSFGIITQFPRVCFKCVGIGILNGNWNPINLIIFLTLLTLPIINGSILATLRTDDLKVFSTCIYVNFPNGQVLLKLLICMSLFENCNEMFCWMKNCFSKKHDTIVDAIWKEVSQQCVKHTIWFTKCVKLTTFTWHALKRFGTYRCSIFFSHKKVFHRCSYPVKYTSVKWFKLLIFCSMKSTEVFRRVPLHLYFAVKRYTLRPHRLRRKSSSLLMWDKNIRKLFFSSEMFESQ